MALNPYFRHPDGHSVKNTSRKEQSKTEFTYWSRLIKPWLAALVAPDGYSIIVTKHFVRRPDALLGRGGQAMNLWERQPSETAKALRMHSSLYLRYAVRP